MGLVYGSRTIVVTVAIAAVVVVRRGAGVVVFGRARTQDSTNDAGHDNDYEENRASYEDPLVTTLLGWDIRLLRIVVGIV